jgi:hypothetical protein
MKTTIKLIAKLFIYLALYAFSLLSFKIANSQNLTQVIKGNVVDVETQTTLPGATVVILGTIPTLGTSTDLNGNYRIENSSAWPLQHSNCLCWLRASCDP